MSNVLNTEITGVGNGDPSGAWKPETCIPKSRAVNRDSNVLKVSSGTRGRDGGERPTLVTTRDTGKPWKPVLDAADRNRGAFTRLVLEAVQQAHDALDMEALETAIARQDETEAMHRIGFALGAMAIQVESRAMTVVQTAMEDGAEAAARHAQKAEGFRFARDTPFSGLHFDLVNPEAVRWARTRAGNLITGLQNETRAAVLKAIRKIIAESFTKGYTTATAARLIRAHIGLTERFAEAVNNLRKTMLENPGSKVWAGKTAIRVPKDGATFDLLAKRGQEYANRLLNLRAKMIARTETMAASNQGQFQLWKQATDQGLLRGTEFKRWIVTPDDRLCEICADMSGEEVPLEANFSIGVESPPAHVFCRCTMGLSRGPRLQG